jgi:hypothetical protein
MKSFDLGYMQDKDALKVLRALDGKTFMNFQVQTGIGPGGTHVDIVTDYEETDAEILTLALHVMATTKGE